MKLQIGKRYITASGHVTFEDPLESTGLTYSTFEDPLSSMTYKPDGGYWQHCADDGLDLVAEYTEPLFEPQRCGNCGDEVFAETAGHHDNKRCKPATSNPASVGARTDHDAEELLHARIRQFEQELSLACGQREHLSEYAESRIASLEQQLADSEHERAKLERMSIVDPEPLQSRISILESALTDVKTELNMHVNPSRPVLLQIVNSALKWNTYTVSVTLSINAESEAQARAEALYQLRGVAEDAIEISLDSTPFVLQDDSIESWLCKLPSGYRERALANFEASVSTNKRTDSMCSALWSAFVWLDTPEGYDFWLQVATRFELADQTMPELPALK